ncbi:hypothetical protein BGX28_006415 [Mortierella sp. GBA30]|nr:hypothetical protein BGX28_006415 [Mortierella sp. GBA30]
MPDLYHLSRFQEIMRSILTPNDPNASVVPQDDLVGHRNIKKLQELYSSCMDEEQLIKVGRRQLEVEIRKIVELYPVFESNLHLVRRQLPDNDRRTLSSLLAYNMRNGFKSFFEFDVMSGIEDPSVNIMTLSESGLGLAVSDYQKEDNVKRYEKIIGQMFYNILGSEGPANTTQDTVPEIWAQIAEDVVGFEMSLARIATEADKLSDPSKTQNMHALLELHQLTPSLDWKLILESAFPPNVSVPATVMIPSPEYFRKLDSLLQQAKPKTIQNYFACSTLGQMIGHYYVQATIPADTVPKMSDIVNSVRQAYATGFSGQYQWLDNTTSRNALDKLHAISQQIGYSTHAPNVALATSIDEYYSTFTVDASDYFGNIIQYTSFKTREKFASLVGSPPFFDVDSPDYLNYGATGVTAGHELGHAFDDSGRQYDGSGRVFNWWTNSSLSAFETRAKCFVEQYSNFTITGPDGKDHPVDGQLTLGENIADNGGLKKAYEAWWRRFQSDPTAKTYNNNRLPGLESHTPEQLFFVQYGRSFCSSIGPQQAVDLLTDTHSPDKWRIIGVLQNSEYFAKAFQCKLGSPMNPVKKCDMW